MGNLVDFMLRVALIPRGLINHETAETSNFDEFKGKDCVFVADWLTSCVPYLKVFKNDLYLIIYKYVLSNKPCIHAEFQKHNRSHCRKVQTVTW